MRIEVVAPRGCESVGGPSRGCYVGGWGGMRSAPEDAHGHSAPGAREANPAHVPPQCRSHVGRNRWAKETIPRFLGGRLMCRRSLHVVEEMLQ